MQEQLHVQKVNVIYHLISISEINHTAISADMGKAPDKLNALIIRKELGIEGNFLNIMRPYMKR
jgi:hypothetical protein